MVIDAHYHPTFFQEVCQSEDAVETRRQTMAYYKTPVVAIERVKDFLISSGVDACFLLPHDYRTLTGDYVSNDDMRKITTGLEDYFFPFASVDPYLKDAATELDYALGELNLYGLKLHLGVVKLYPHDEKIMQLCEVCLHHDKPIIFHTGLSWQRNSELQYTHPLLYEAIAIKFPKLRICLAHMGFPWITETVSLLLKYPNLYVDTASLYFDSAQEFYEYLFNRAIPLTWYERSLRHQIMFGSNMPRWEQMRMLKAIHNLGFRKDTLELILHRNALEFIGEEPVTWLS